ncbi:MAG: M23 family metallopeptidase, partial [Candidatus Peregrinibacteria bacterium]
TGVEQYQAREIRSFIALTEQRQGESAWIVALAAMRRLTREERWRAETVALAPSAVNRAARLPIPVLRVTPVAQQTDRAKQEVSRPATPLPSLRPSAPTATSLQGQFPAFDHTVYPVSQVPNWGAMRTSQEWERTYGQMTEEDFVRLPSYDMGMLTIPLASLVNPIRPESIPILTAKLAYSTRYYGAYDLDAGEFSGLHPGVDLKLAFGTPVGALAGGRVQTVGKDANMGLYVIVEHRLPDGETFFSLYGHLDTAGVSEGQEVQPGRAIGTVGMSGNTTAPHVHLQVDRDDGPRPHVRYWPSGTVSRAEANRHTINPIEFIERLRGGVG